MITIHYTWQGIDKNGLMQTGQIENSSQQAVITSLQQKNISPLYIKKTLNLSWKRRKKISAKNLNIFWHELAILIQANIPIIKALTMITKDCNHPQLLNMIVAIKNTIEEGQSLSCAIRQYPHIFNQVTANLVNVGEKTGTLDVVLKHIVTLNEKTLAQRQQFIKALFYPAIVSIVAILVTSILLIFVVPQFETMFLNFGASLPFYTQLIIYLASYVKNYGLILLATIIIFAISIHYAQKHSLVFAQKIDNLLLKLPLIGLIIKTNNLAHISRTVGLAFKAGVPLLETFALTSATLSHLNYQEALLKVAQKITEGHTLHAALSQNSLFPERVVQFIAIGEESGTLEEMFLTIAEHYENELKNITGHLNNLLEPVITIILGIIIGGIVIGMYLPIFSLGKII